MRSVQQTERLREHDASTATIITLRGRDEPAAPSDTDDWIGVSLYDFGGPDDVLAEVDEDQVPASYTHTLLPEGAVVDVIYQRGSFALRRVAGAFKLTAMMRIIDGDFADRPLFYGRNVPGPGWLHPSHFLARDWVAVMPENVRPPCLPKFNPKPSTRDKKARARLRRVGRALLEELFTGADDNGVILRVSTTRVTRYMDAKPGEKGQWVKRPERLWYSRLDAVLSREAGWPRGAARRRRASRCSV